MQNFLARLAAILILCWNVACQQTSEAQKIVDQAMAAHGSARLESLQVSFDFRDRHYTYSRSGGDYTYTRSFIDSSGQVLDILTNSSFHRLINGDTTNLPQERKKAFSNSVNSVIYFALLPWGLNDAAVNKAYLGETTLAGETYHLVKVTFDKEGGGEDYEDKFLYWFHTKNLTMDYMAYSYQTEGGGLRFRKAINPRVVRGVRFQDYVNHTPKQKGIPLESLQVAYEQGLLEVLSEIALENIQVAPLPADLE